MDNPETPYMAFRRGWICGYSAGFKAAILIIFGIVLTWFLWTRIDQVTAVVAGMFTIGIVTREGIRRV